MSCLSSVKLELAAWLQRRESGEVSGFFVHVPRLDRSRRYSYCSLERLRCRGWTDNSYKSRFGSQVRFRQVCQVQAHHNRRSAQAAVNSGSVSVQVSVLQCNLMTATGSLGQKHDSSRIITSGDGWGWWACPGPDLWPDFWLEHSIRDEALARFLPVCSSWTMCLTTCCPD